MLTSWHAAFPSATSINSADMAMHDTSSTIVWLRLNAGATVAQQIALVRERLATTPHVVLSDIPNDLEALAVFSVGARGYCNSHAGPEVLINVANVVAQGGMWIGESIMQRLLNNPAPESSSAPKTSHFLVSNLTGRESEVANEVALGLSNKEIAAHLNITERTVKAHIGAVLDKLQLKSRLQLALFVKNS